MADHHNSAKDELDEHKGDTDPESETVEPEAQDEMEVTTTTPEDMGLADDDANESTGDGVPGPQAPDGAGRTGDRVGYTSTHKGCLKMATVAFDDRTFQRGTSAPQLTTVSARHLMVVGMNHQYMKHDVPYGRPGQPGTWHELPE